MNVLLTVLVAAAAAAGYAPQLERAERAAAEQRYDEALTLYQLVHGAKDASDDDQVRALLGMGTVHVIKNETEMARRHFRAALRLDPDATLPDDAPSTARHVLRLVAAELPAPAPPAEPAARSDPRPPVADSLAPPAPDRPTAPDDAEDPPWLLYGGIAGGVALGVAVLGATGTAIFLATQPSLGVETLP